MVPTADKIQVQLDALMSQSLLNQVNGSDEKEEVKQK